VTNKTWHAVLTAYLLAVVVAASIILVQLFGDAIRPDAPADESKSPTTAALVRVADANAAAPERFELDYLAGRATINQDTRLILLALVMGVLGSVVHALTSLADYVGNETFRKRWASWYLFRPWIGGALALVLYFVLRGGLMTASSGPAVNPYGIAALCGMTGMFSKQATDKLEEVLSMILRTAGNAGDARRGDKVDGAAKPTLLEIRPPIVEANKADQQIEIVGQGFADGCKVLVGDQSLDPEQVEKERILVRLPVALLAQPGTLQIRVQAGADAVSDPMEVEVVTP
jgi:hypothetical protein